GASCRVYFEHRPPDLALGGAGGWGHDEIDEEAVTVLHQGVRGEAEARLLAVAFACEARLQVGRRCMRLVAALLAAEVDRRIAWIVRRIAVLGLLVLWAEALR